jgi:hypothetical protein
MSVDTFAHFVTAVGNLAPASGNVYQCIDLGLFATGIHACKIQQKLKGAGTFVDYQTMVWEGQFAQYISADDANPVGMSLRFVGADGVQKVVDAQLYLNNLA